MQAASRAAYNLGITQEATTEELFKAMEAGKLMAEEFLPELSKELMKSANEGGALENAMESTGAAIGRFRTNVWLANKTFNEAGFDTTIRNIMNTLSQSIMQAEPLWQLLGQASEFLGRALETPIELFGVLSERLSYFTDESGQANSKLKLLIGSAIAAFKPFRRLFAIFYLLPESIAAVTDTIDEGFSSWEDFFLKMAIWAGTALMFASAIGKAAKAIKKLSGATFGGSRANRKADLPSESSRRGDQPTSEEPPTESRRDRSMRRGDQPTSEEPPTESRRDRSMGRGAAKTAGKGVGAFFILDSIKDLLEGGVIMSGERNGEKWSINAPNLRQIFSETPMQYEPSLGPSGGIGQGQLPFGEVRIDSLNINVEGSDDPENVADRVYQRFWDTVRETSANSPVEER